MGFKYRNLSKSLFYLLMPVLAGCGVNRTKSAPESHRDSIDVVYNNASMAEKCYDDLIGIVISAENYGPCEALEKYQEAKMLQLVNSQLYYDDIAILASRQRHSKAGVNGAGQYSYDSLCAAYDRMIVAQRCYTGFLKTLRADYGIVGRHLDGNEQVVRNYQVQKMFELYDSLAHFQAEQSRLLQQKNTLLRTK